MALTLNIIQPHRYILVAWNVNGYTPNVHTWLLSYVQTHHPDIIFLSETKKQRKELQEFFSAFTEYNFIINAHEPCQWHGVAMLIRKPHVYQEIPIALNIARRKDSKGADAAMGRIIIICLNTEFFIIGSYTPNSGRSDSVKLDYRTKVWDPAFTYVLELFKNKGPVLWMGDINAVKDDQDISNPKTMRTYAGNLPEEKANFQALLNTGEWIDVWRKQNPDAHVYTWGGGDYGMRLDNIIVSKSLFPAVSTAFTVNNSPALSDHIPIGVYINTH